LATYSRLSVIDFPRVAVEITVLKRIISIATCTNLGKSPRLQ